MAPEWMNWPGWHGVAILAAYATGAWFGWDLRRTKARRDAFEAGLLIAEQQREIADLAANRDDVVADLHKVQAELDEALGFK
jgi:hypothetical protein